MNTQKESTKQLVEAQCIRTFLNWYNKRFNTRFNYKRAENVFTKIIDSTRWDFVVTENKSPMWFAVEIKRLTKPEVKIQLVWWNKFLKSIKSSLLN